uniref:FUSC family protein n=1 Tax=Dietzia sp. TaxID=1871616 RepID=UPI002FDA2209
PEAYFLMLGCGVVNFMIYAHDISPWRVFTMTLVGGIAAVLGTMAELVPDPYGPERKAVTAAVEATRAYADSAAGEDSRPLHRRAAEAMYRARTELTDARPVFPRAPWAARRMRSIEALEADLDAAERAFEARVGAAAERILALDPPAGLGDPDGSSGSFGTASAAGSGTAEEGALSERLQGVARAGGGRPSVPTLLRQAASWPSDQLVSTFRVGVASAIAGIVTVLIGGEHIYWSTAFAAVALNQGGARIVQSYRAVNRLVGTVFGVFLFALIAAIHPSGIVLVLVMIALQYLIELVVAKQYALATFLLTPLALIISVGGALPHSPWSVLSERLIDTVIGVSAAFIAVWCFGRGMPRSVLHGQTGRTLRAMSDYLAAPGDGERRETLVLGARELESVASAVATERGTGTSRSIRSAREVTEVAYVLLGAEGWRHRRKPGSADSADPVWRSEGIAGFRENIDRAARELDNRDGEAAGARIDGLVEDLSRAVRRR